MELKEFNRRSLIVRSGAGSGGRIGIRGRMQNNKADSPDESGGFRLSSSLLAMIPRAGLLIAAGSSPVR